MILFRRVSVLFVAAALVTACGSSSGTSTTSDQTPSNGPRSSSSPAGSAAPSKPLPAPCTLLTTDDVAPLFGTKALDMTPTTGPGPGTAQCSFGLKVGSQGKGVTVKTRNDFASDPSYIFPDQATTPVSGLGFPAVIQNTNTNQAAITVKLGKNALEINVSFYTQPVDNTFLTRLAKAALART